MQRKAAAYISLSFLSFCFFTVLFQTTVHAATLPPLPSPSAQIADIVASPPKVDDSPMPTAILLTSSSTGDAASAPTQPPSPSPIIVQDRPALIAVPTLTPAPSHPQQTPDPTAAPIPSPSVIFTGSNTNFTIGGQAVSAVAPTPTQTPIPTVPPAAASSTTDIPSLFSKYSNEYHVDENELKKIAQCESGFNTNSNNSGLYLGMFQFASSSWSSVRTSMGLDPNPGLRTNAEEAIKTAAYMLAHGGQNAWPNCK